LAATDFAAPATARTAAIINSRPRKRSTGMGHARALVVEPNSTTRSVMCAQLRDMGVADVRHTAKLAEARLLLERERFDIVLCSRDFEDPEITGQDLVDELRREQLLPHATVFIMIATQATYAQVTEAGEASLDGLLLRPYTAATMAERVMEARRRKQELADLLGALSDGDFAQATQLALARYHRGAAYAGYAARVAAELLLMRGDTQGLQTLCEHVLKQGGGEWARLAMVRAQVHRGDLVAARRACESLLDEQPGNADAFDLLGRIHLEHGDIARALDAYRRAVELTPGCLLRLQACGTLAFYAHDNPLALQTLDRCVSLGVRSKLFDALSLFLLAVLQFDARNHKGMLAAHEQLRRYAQRFPESTRLAGLDQAVSVLVHVQRNELDAAQSMARDLAAALETDEGTLEQGIVALTAWSRLPSRDVSAGELEAVVRVIGNRFCVSKSMTELLAAAGDANPQIRTIVKACQQETAEYLEQAMSHALAGRPRETVCALLDRGHTTRNAKLLETATLVARRYGEQIPDGPELAEDAVATTARVCQPVTLVAGIRRTGRSAGGLVLRT
jgi:CheY-like chemotaxis protein